MYKVTRVVSGVAGSPFYITGYFSVAGGTAQAAASAWADLFGTLPTSAAAGSIWQPITEVPIIEAATGQAVATEPVTVTGFTGSSSNQRLPAATQGLLRWRTNLFLNGRRVRGRTAIPLPRTVDNSDSTGAPVAAYVTGWTSGGTNLINNEGCELVVYSRTNGEYAPVVSASAWSQWSVLRSRRD